jgi:regulator of PEP synthase PpsR (kinase-PPPase family)
MPHRSGSYFHLHLISDATGETLTTVARAATAQYTKMTPVEHVYPLVRTQKQLDRVLAEIDESPGIVLYTLLEDVLVTRLENHCRDLSVPCLSILGPVLALLQSYLGTETSHRVGAQHTLNAEYFKRIDAFNFTMLHDDGQHIEDLEEADVVLVGVSRTSKTPTSIYLANRGVKTANVPLVPGIPLASSVEELKRPLMVGLYASPERIVQIRQNRRPASGQTGRPPVYRSQGGGRRSGYSRKLCAKHNWPSIDVTRRSSEETAAAVLKLLTERRRRPVA